MTQPEVFPGLLDAKVNGFQYVPPTGPMCFAGLRMFGDPAPLLSALAMAQGEFEPILKTKVNPFFNNKYADLADVLAACLPALNKHGLSLNQLPTRPDNSGNWTVYTILGHKSGSFWMLESVIPAAEWQKFGSALTYNRRYTDSAVLGVASEPDDDGNAADGKTEESKGPRQNTRPNPPQAQQKASPPKAAAPPARSLETSQGEAVASGGDSGGAPTGMGGKVDSAPPRVQGESARSSPAPAAEAKYPDVQTMLKAIGDALKGGRLYQTKDGEVKWFTKATSDALAKETVGKPVAAIASEVDADKFLLVLNQMPEPTAKQRETWGKLRAKFGKDREQAELFCADIIGHGSDWVCSETECDELLEALNR